MAPRLLLIAVLSLAAGASEAAAQSAPSSRFCIVPVENSAPTDREIGPTGSTWRMVSNVVMLPGVSRPVIYAVNRGGVWTIDKTRTYVPFGGEFPYNLIYDKFAHDPETGRIVGVSNAKGLFVLDPGEDQFRKIYGVSRDPLRHPYSVTFIPRMKGFVVADATGLYLLQRSGELIALPASNPELLLTPFRVIDLPAFGAMVVNAIGKRVSAHVAVRYDDGEVVRVASLGRWPPIGVEVAADGTVVLRNGTNTHSVKLKRPPVGPIVQAGQFSIEQIARAPGRRAINAASVGKSFQFEPKAGVFEVLPNGRRAIALPFEPESEPIGALAEMPASKSVLIFTSKAVYALDADGAVVEIPGGRDVGAFPIDSAQGTIPVRNEMILFGKKSLYLALDTRFAGSSACPASP